MGLKYQIDSLDGLDESVAAMYVEKDGKFVLDVSGLPEPPKPPDTPVIPTPEDTTGLKSALKKEREARKVLEKQAKTFDGLDPIKYKEMTERITELKAQEDAAIRKEAEKKGQWEKLEQDLQAESVRKLAAVNTAASEKESTLLQQIADVTSAMEVEIGEKAIIAAISKAEGNTTLLMPHINGKIKVVKQDSGKYEPVVVNASGEIRYDTAGAPMTPDALIEEIKTQPEFQVAFKTKTQAGGSDSTGGHEGGSTPNNPFKKETLNLTEQGKLITTDPKQAEKLKKEAGIS